MVLAAGVLVVETSFDNSTDVFTCNKTWEEINQAAFAVIVTDFSDIGGYDIQILRFIVTETFASEGVYNVTTASGEYGNAEYVEMCLWVALSASDYPKFRLY